MTSSRLQVLAALVGERLLAAGQSVTCAESCTGGGIGQALTSVAGSSRWFERGFITYSNRAKEEMLGVSAALLEREGAVSSACVQAMVAGALERSPAQLAVAVSGIAGPDGGSADKPVGTVFIAWGRRGGDTRWQRFHFAGGRDSVRAASVEAALAGLLESLGASLPA